MRTIKDSNLAYLITRVTLGLSAPRLRNRILFRVASVTPQSRIGHEGVQASSTPFLLALRSSFLPFLWSLSHHSVD